MAVRVVAVIDGEHLPELVRGALDRLEQDHELCGVLFVGGEEKVGEAVLADATASYGRPVAIARETAPTALRQLLAEPLAEAVIDLSGEPVLDNSARFRLASVALDLGLEYRAPGLRLTPPPYGRVAFAGPVLSVIGTGKRTGKTAIAGHWASLLGRDGFEPVIVAMGRGGPAEPQLVRREAHLDLRALLEIARRGAHAASDYLEDALLTGVSTVGCRRCGEGPAGEPFDCNVAEGATLAASLGPDALLLEGSGAAIPPLETHRTVCVTSAANGPDQALGFLGPYRLLRAQLVVITGAEHVTSEKLRELRSALAEWCDDVPVLACSLEPEPADSVPAGARVALFTTAPPEREPRLRESLERRGIDVRAYSSNLARRDPLASDLEHADREGCDIFLTELKAAAIDMVAAHAGRRGAEVVFLRNRPMSLRDERELDAELLRLFAEARDVAAAEPAAA
jgi:cyclic 2,3-diphosphoglycerate synthetase